MEKNLLLFEAENVNDEGWNVIIKTLKDNLPGFEVLYGDGNYMEFKWDSEEYEEK